MEFKTAGERNDMGFQRGYKGQKPKVSVRQIFSLYLQIMLFFWNSVSWKPIKARVARSVSQPSDPGSGIEFS